MVFTQKEDVALGCPRLEKVAVKMEGGAGDDVQTLSSEAWQENHFLVNPRCDHQERVQPPHH